MCSFLSHSRTSNPTQSNSGSHHCELSYVDFQKKPTSNPFYFEIIVHCITDSCKDSTERSPVCCIPHPVSPVVTACLTMIQYKKLGSWHWYNICIILCYFITCVDLCNHCLVKIQNYSITTEVFLLLLSAYRGCIDAPSSPSLTPDNH